MHRRADLWKRRAWGWSRRTRLAGALALILITVLPAGLNAQSTQVGGAQEAAAEPAEEALITDRPDFTESPVSVAPGRFQFEGGYTFSRVDEEKDHTIGELLVRIGAVDRLEFRLGINSWVLRNAPDEGAGEGPPEPSRTVRGLEDLTLGFKVEILRPLPDAAGVPQLAILAGTSLPTGRSDFGSDAVQPGAILAAAWDLTGWLSLGTNVGYAYPEVAGDRFDELSASVAFGFGVSDRTGIFAEYFGTYPLPSDRDAGNNADAGVTYLLGPSFQLDARVGVGLDGPRPNFFVGAGASWRI